jgi:hypothetical protein
MKLKVSEDELYPIYDLGDGFGKEVEVTEEFYKEYTEVMDKFWVIQGVLSELHNSVPNEKSPYAFCNMDDYEEDGVDDRGLLKFKLKERYNFSWEDKL